jgi:hypothetical protein
MLRNKAVWIGSLMALASSLPLSTAGAAGPQIPTMTMADLNGRALKVPTDMTGDPAIWVVAFDQVQQSQVDHIQRLAEVAEPGIVFWEVPLIEDPGTLVRWFINSGMRSGIQDQTTRARVVTFYVPDRAAWMKLIGVGGTDQAYAILVSKNGTAQAVAAHSKLKTQEQMTAFLAQAKAPAP